MPNSTEDFDAIGIVVEWINACKKRDLAALLNLYDPAACIECCEGGTFRGRSELETYWRPKLAASSAPISAFAVDALMPTANGVSLDYRGYDAKPVRNYFEFGGDGKISRTSCTPIKAAA